jgi:hypothetical protein
LGAWCTTIEEQNLTFDQLLADSISTWPDALSPELLGQTVAAVHAIAAALA